MLSHKSPRFRGALLLVLGMLLLTAYGCGHKDTDSSDPDPHYYKGKNFVHKRTG